MTNDEFETELKRLSANLAEQERITADLTRRVEILEGKVEGKATGYRIVYPAPKQGGKRGA